MLLAIEITTIIASIAVFLAFTLFLVGLILYAKAKLTSTGVVKIMINGQQIVEAEGGSSLLTTLGNKKLFLPSACGGGGTCAMCRCQVLSGGGEILPTEKNIFYPQRTTGKLEARLPGEGETGHGNQDS